jgi:uncharacterized RDD family membrane protein YckC
MDARNPYAAPESSGEPAPRTVAAPSDAEPAGFAIRSFGRVIDWTVSLAVAFAGGAIFRIGLSAAGAAGIHAGAMAPRNSLGVVAVVFAIDTAGGIAYHVLAEGIGGASLGKLVLGLRVRHCDLTRPRLKGAMIRSLAYYVDGLFFGLVGYSAMSSTAMMQRYGDKWGDTVVVKAASLPDDPDAASRILLGLVCGLAANLLSVIASGVVSVAM